MERYFIVNRWGVVRDAKGATLRFMVEKGAEEMCEALNSLVTDEKNTYRVVLGVG